MCGSYEFDVICSLETANTHRDVPVVVLCRFTQSVPKGRDTDQNDNRSLDKLLLKYEILSFICCLYKDNIIMEKFPLRIFQLVRLSKSLSFVIV